MTRQGRLFVVGLGPGAREAMTGQAREALHRAEVVIGYDGYFTGLADLVEGKECHSLPLTREVERARLAVERLRAGRIVCVISSGDPGVYAMASLVLECAAAEDERLLADVEIVPGVSAVNAAAALLGAPLGHDFAVVSLSDLLTAWDAIERRLRRRARPISSWPFSIRKVSGATGSSLGQPKSLPRTGRPRRPSASSATPSGRGRRSRSPRSRTWPRPPSICVPRLSSAIP